MPTISTDFEQIIALWMLVGVVIFVMSVPILLRQLCRRRAARTPDPVEEMRLAKRKAFVDESLIVKPWKGKEETVEEKMEQGQATERATPAVHSTTRPQARTHTGKSSMPEIAQQQAEEDDEEDHPECSICLGEFEPNQWICASNNPSCKHSFHLDCMKEWLMKHDGCPVCRETYLLEAATAQEAEEARSAVVRQDETDTASADH